jgi:hypothetical protein
MAVRSDRDRVLALIDDDVDTQLILDMLVYRGKITGWRKVNTMYYSLPAKQFRVDL